MYKSQTEGPASRGIKSSNQTSKSKTEFMLTNRVWFVLNLQPGFYLLFIICDLIFLMTASTIF
jgi:hypothetical protein